MRARYVIRRLLQGLVTLWVIATITFLLFRLLPGDPTYAVLDPTFPADVRELLRERFGLDQPMSTQYVRYLANLARGEFGRSFFYNLPAMQIIRERLINTLILAMASFVLAYSIGIVGGVLMAWRRGTRFELVAATIALVFRAAPMFWTGMLAVMLFSFKLDWLPHAGLRTPGYEAVGFLDKYLSLDFLAHLVMPATISALYFLGFPLLLLRNTMLEVLGEDYIELARAKGLSDRRIMFHHAARNALLPIVTSAAVYIGLALGGIAVIEYVFSWPGLGLEIVAATQRRDFPIAQAAFLLLGTMVVVMNFVADLVYSYLDPRIAFQ